jgi:ElaB/YqjD/DUF883 family membrane-anchored ribosome-binding protein
MVTTTTPDTETLEPRKRAGNGGHPAQREVEAGYEHLKEAAGNFKGAAVAASQEAKVAAEKGMDATKANARDLYSRAEAMVHERPLAALGVAFLTGYVISRLLRR